ncbi:reverse transcriptase domain-containing protein [Tanacetum coccineum]|uniref:Reverse transcriptase domain-containing protein n=1 Tax=Tanacetum coccineum TaxID=301880 RepID=A0ABQ5HLS5_9ASTR
MPTWCHMFNSTLTGNAKVWFNDLPQESIDSYDDLKKAFLENYLQQKKCIKDPVKIHNIKQREGESTEDFVRRYKLECRDVKGAPKCMKISRFMHGITNPELIKRLHEKIPKSVDEIMRVTTAFLREAKLQKGRLLEPTKAGAKAGQGLSSHDLGPPGTKWPVLQYLDLHKKFKPPPPITTPVEKRNASKFCEFHGEVGHTTDECIHLNRQIEEMLKAGKLSHLIKELKQSNGKDQAKRVAKPRVTQTFSPESVISFLPLGEEDGTEGPVIIKAEMGRHFIHRMYVDGVGQISLLVKIGDEEHSTSAWMNFMVREGHHLIQTEIIGRTIGRWAKGVVQFLGCNLIYQRWNPTDMTEFRGQPSGAQAKYSRNDVYP